MGHPESTPPTAEHLAEALGLSVAEVQDRALRLLAEITAVMPARIALNAEESQQLDAILAAPPAPAPALVAGFRRLRQEAARRRAGTAG